MTERETELRSALGIDAGLEKAIGHGTAGRDALRR
jgi:hypothetical protein